MEMIQITIRGETDLIMHNPAGSMKLPGSALGKKEIPTPEEEAEASTYRLPNTDLAVPATSVRNITVGNSAGNAISGSGIASYVVPT